MFDPTVHKGLTKSDNLMLLKNTSHIKTHKANALHETIHADFADNSQKIEKSEKSLKSIDESLGNHKLIEENVVVNVNKSILDIDSQEKLKCIQINTVEDSGVKIEVNEAHTNNPLTKDSEKSKVKDLLKQKIIDKKIKSISPVTPVELNEKPSAEHEVEVKSTFGQVTTVESEIVQCVNKLAESQTINHILESDLSITNLFQSNDILSKLNAMLATPKPDFTVELLIVKQESGFLRDIYPIHHVFLAVSSIE